ncbi:outer membrane protein [Bartonella raoultii]|uniref:Outer membrane beta-barrel protein n=1 Tax=Bartonella raoultii TaxID=1457020 RepID=A0ABS7I889_9HYPH|nr:outer membrane beta-barrel protein [Bartonella raoultii]MBX4335814.1 outer membrane beta-barrel protein [Bartonella raoultii]
MKRKYLMTISLATLMATSAAHAADTLIFPSSTESVSPPYTTQSISPSYKAGNRSPVIIDLPFSWCGFYIGGKVGGFSDHTSVSHFKSVNLEKWAPADKNLFSKSLKYNASLYTGYNFDIGDNFIIGVEADIALPIRKSKKLEKEQKILNEGDLNSIKNVFEQAEIPIIQPTTEGETIPNINDIVVSNTTFKEEVSGSIRMRIGYNLNRIMPYISGGVALSKQQYIMSILSKSHETQTRVFASGDVINDTKKVFGYTVGGGFDFAMTNNIIFRTEYSYLDFANDNNTFAEDKLKLYYKTHNMRMGISYKF